MSLQVLVIPAYRLFPIQTGAGVAQYGMIDELDKSNVADSQLEELKRRWANVRFIAWSEVKKEWEQEHKPSIINRISNRISPRKAVELPTNIAIPSSLRAAWDNCSILFYDTPQWRIGGLKHHLKKQRYDLVQTDLPSNLPLINAKSSGPSDGLDALKRREQELMSHYDHCLFFSEEDKSVLKVPKVKGHISPFPVLNRDFISGDRGPARRLIFIGPEHHGPNKEAVDWLFYDLLGALPPNWTVRVVGLWSQEYQDTHKDERVVFEGFVDDLLTLYEESMMIVPVRSGAGIRTKILQAMAAGVPVLATQFAIEGVGAVEGEHYMRFEDADGLSAAIQSMSNSESRTNLCAAARDLVSQQFSQAVLGQRRASLLESFSKGSSVDF